MMLLGPLSHKNRVQTPSYARATLLNVLCNHYTGNSDGSETEAQNRKGHPVARNSPRTLIQRFQR